MNCCPTCKQPAPHKILVDLETGRLSYEAAEIKLTPREAEILHLLWEYYPYCVSRDSLCNRINGRYGSSFGTETLKVHVSHIRRKLLGLPLSISKFGREGYQLEFSA